jgi:serine-protein kinase ATM
MRQDAIMEQVFEQTSKLLKNHNETRLRNLHIRTYKVLPLSARSGMMEFVQNTISLHDVLIPHHHRYHPSDWKNDKCRSEIGEAAKSNTKTRIDKFKDVMAHFSPVGRHFFLELFEDPYEWFEKRLAYTRTTAAISMLGWVLGLGDRHCQNILIDQQKGEVVHIDLGVAFEMGRILPIPEVVPFRLTRDIVDAMGYTKTEGVFRRCCEFTLESLRAERESIMILLNVLRYDPLVSWSISPLRAKRLQEGQDQEQDDQQTGLKEPEYVVEHSPRSKDDEGGDAGRALAVVEKKLSSSLGTAATVATLIQQATDPVLLAQLFCGKPRVDISMSLFGTDYFFRMVSSLLTQS